MTIDANHEKLQYSGRIDWSNPKEPVFVYPCTSLRMRFTGSILKIHVRNKNAYWENFLGCIIDEKQVSLALPQNGDVVLTIPVEDINSNLDRKIHDVLFFKRQDSCHELTILDLEIGEGEKLIELPKKPERKIEVYGDSVSAGEVSEAVEYTGKEDPAHNGEYSNSWYSYAWMTARKCKAQIHDVAQGGIALMDKTGWFYEPNAVGMESVFDKIHYNPEFGEPMEWDFSNYIPQVVIIAIGQNDSHPSDYMREDYDGEQAIIWRKSYKKFLEKIRGLYPDAYMICCTTLLEHDEAWDLSIKQVVHEMNDKKITQYVFKRNGRGTPGHLRISEAEEMAEELAAYIEGLHVKGWE